jgi:signal transduction histidine kinase
VNPEELVFKAGRAMEVFHIRALQNHLHTDSIEESARKADAHAAPQKLSLKNLHRYTKTLLESLQTNFNQGAGIGMLISLVSLLMMQAKKEGSNYVVPAETMDLILQNASMAEKALNRINELHFLQDRDLEVVPFSREQVHKMLQEIIASVEPFGKIKNHRIHLADNDVFFDKGELRLNRSLFSQALQEILINAFKFSLENTDVYVIYGAMDKILSLSILNSPHSKDLRQSGFVNDLNQIIFEPFFREEKAVDERFATLDYGLGLTYAKVIIERHGGTISASSVQDDRISPEQLVSIDIELPLIASEERDDSVMRF